MKNISIVTLIAITVLLAGCLSGMVQTSKRISSNLESREFNSIASRYMIRPTFVNVDIMKDGSRVLKVTIDSYGTKQPSVPFCEIYKTKYIEAIDKYLEWEAQALRNKDMLDKEILRVRNPNTLIIYLDFHSGNENNHFLNVGFLNKGLMGEIKVPILSFDRKNAIELKKLLQSFSSIDTTPVENRYN